MGRQNVGLSPFAGTLMMFGSWGESKQVDSPATAQSGCLDVSRETMLVDVRRRGEFGLGIFSFRPSFLDPASPFGAACVVLQTLETFRFIRDGRAAAKLGERWIVDLGSSMMWECSQSTSRAVSPAERVSIDQSLPRGYPAAISAKIWATTSGVLHIHDVPRDVEVVEERATLRFLEQR